MDDILNKINRVGPSKHSLEEFSLLCSKPKNFGDSRRRGRRVVRCTFPALTGSRAQHLDQA